MPSTAVYFEAVPPSMASLAACLMWSGVSKSGSPTPRPITSRPAALSARAMSVTAMVGEGLMRLSDSARKAMAVSDRPDRGRQTPKGRPAVRQGPARGNRQDYQSHRVEIWFSHRQLQACANPLLNQIGRRAPGDLLELWRRAQA